MKELLTTAELAAKWKVHEKTIYNYRLEGMPTVLFGRAVRFDPDEVTEWIRNRQPIAE